MPETPTGSEEDRPSGGAPEGTGVVDTPTAGAPVADADANELARRRWQSDLDRERAARAAAEAELAKLKGTPEVPTEKALTAADVASVVRETMRREGQVRDIVALAPTEFPNADPALLADPSKFDSPEAFKVALKASSDTNGARIAAERERIAAEVRKEYGIKLHGSESGSGEPPKDTDQLTAAMVANAGVEDLREMSDTDLKRLAHSFTEEA